MCGSGLFEGEEMVKETRAEMPVGRSLGGLGVPHRSVAVGTGCRQAQAAPGSAFSLMRTS